MDLLLKLDEVCKKHNLTYFLMFGSLLGAIRHNGFIPWDDDLDVAMPRKDYEKLLLLKDEFEEPYFLQTLDTDEGYYQSFIRLRNSNTCGIQTKFKFQKTNMGLILDIFPIDNIDLEDAHENYNKIKEMAYDISTYMRMSNPNLSEEDQERVKNYSGNNPLETYEKIQKIATQYNDKDTKYVSVSVLTIYPYKNNVFEKKDFEEAVLHEFEGFKFPIPMGYKNILNVIYGDYMQFPPYEKRGCWHKDVIYEPDISYKEYLKREGIFYD